MTAATGVCSSITLRKPTRAVILISSAPPIGSLLTVGSGGNDRSLVFGDYVLARPVSMLAAMSLHWRRLGPQRDPRVLRQMSLLLPRLDRLINFSNLLSH